MLQNVTFVSKCILVLIFKYNDYMKLSQKAINSLTVRTKNRLALELDCSAQTIERWIKENESNGNLTKAKAVQIIREETKLPDAQILQDKPVKV